jgi:ribulose-5-phosphate 4-epimerase/fuculose-1-phosphate aldolase
MDRLVSKFASKLVAAGLASKERSLIPLVGGLDDELVWNREGAEIDILEEVFAGLNINSLVCFRPVEPYGPIIAFLSRQARGVIEPKDCETRTFLHDLPVVNEFSATAIIHTLKRSKSVIIVSEDQGPMVLAHGAVSPEQGFVVVSSVCFAAFVKFFTDYLDVLQSGQATAGYHQAYDHAISLLASQSKGVPALMAAPFADEAQVYQSIAQAGRETVSHHLVDSYFGNVSYRWQDTLYISQTGSSLDELKGCVDPVPLDGSTSAGLTASSELSAHLEIVGRTGRRAILHGHPKFAVIMSMDCAPKRKARCPFVDQCHIKCPQTRFVQDIPIVPGEVGTGPTGLCHTLPPAIEQHHHAIVYGHGLFTTGLNDFNEAMQSMLAIEEMCREKYIEKVTALRK